MTDLERIADGDRAFVASQSSQSSLSRPEASIPLREEEAQRKIARLLHPTRGIERGLHGLPPEKLISVRVDELRLTGTVLRLAARALAERTASVDTHPQGGDAVAAPFMSGAVPSEETADAQTSSEHPNED